MTSPHEQKKRKINGSVVVTANRLGDGAVVYRTVDDAWTTDISDAAVVTAPAAAVLLQRAEADGVRAVGAYIAPVDVTPDQIVRPGNLRERIRVGGPTFALPGDRTSPAHSRASGNPAIQSSRHRPWVPAFAGTSGERVSDAR